MSGIMEDGAEQVTGEIDVSAIRERFRVAMEEEKNQGQTVPKIAQKAGIGTSTLYAFMQGTFSGENANVARKLASFLLTREARKQTRATVRRAPGFLKTTTAGQIFAVLEYAQSEPDMAIICGGAGIGKTTAIHAYQAVGSNVWIMTAEPAINTVASLLDMLMDGLGMEPGFRGSTMSRRLKQRLTGSEGLIIIDEAQNLRPVLRDQLRSTVFDAAGIGVALVGNESLDSQFARERATGQYAQLISRFGQRVNRPKPYGSDVDLLLAAWGIQGAEAQEVAMKIALMPGALRQMNKTLKIAFSLSDLRAGSEEPSAADIKEAWKQLGGAG